MKCGGLTQLGVGCCVLITAVFAGWAQDPGARARAILSDASKSAPAAREALLSLGDASINAVLDVLATEKDAPQPRQAFLVGILGSLHSAQGNRALWRTLDDARPLVRANAAIALAKNHEACAVPRLLRLLDDPAEYGKEASTDPYTEKSLTVGAAAAKALRMIIGERPRGSVGSLRSIAESWWGRHERGLNCRSWN